MSMPLRPTFIATPPFRISHLRSPPSRNPLAPHYTNPSVPSTHPRPSHIPQAISAPPAPRPPPTPPSPSPSNPLQDPHVLHITSVKSFLQLMAQSATEGRVVALLYHAKYCRACKYMRPHFVRLAKKLQGDVVFAMVEQDEAYELCSRLGVRFLPLVMVYQGGRGKVEEFGWGPAQLELLKVKLRKYVGEESVELLS